MTYPTQPNFVVYETQKLHASNNQVKQIQLSLPKWTAQENLIADGVFGTKTENAVRFYQDMMGLSVDGIVGKDTARMLGIWSDIEKGFDISHWNTILWDNVPIDYTFVNVKASEGATYVDPNVRKNITSASNIGLDTGAYHFTSFQNPPTNEAANFLNAIQGLQVNSVYLDLEYRKSGLKASEIEAWVLSFLKFVESSFPKSSIGIYTSSNYLKEVGLTFAYSFSEYKLWAADWKKQPFVYPWKIWDIWQYSVDNVDWCEGELDLNYRRK